MSRDYTPILAAILEEARLALAENPPARVELTPGLLPAWDDCCAGQLYLRVIEIYPTAGVGAAFPAIDSSQRGAGLACAVKLMAVHIGLGVIRCAHTVDDNGNPPTPAEVTADASEMLDDMSALLDVIVCQVPGVSGVMQVKLDRWQPQGVEGGCHGGEWGAYLAIDPCLCS